MRPLEIKTEKLTGWDVVYKSFDPAGEKLRESLCTLGNGYLGLRGAASGKSHSEDHYPGTYIAGLFNTLPTMVAGKKIFNEDLVNCPNPLLFSFRANKKKWTDSDETELLSHSQKLDLKVGLLLTTQRVKDRSGNITVIREKRIVSMKHPHLVCLQYDITPKNYSGELLIRSSIDGTVENSGVPRYRSLNSKHLLPISSGLSQHGILHLTMKTNQSGIEISTASKIKIFRGQRLTKPRVRLVKEKKKTSCELRVPAKKNETIRVEKTCAIFTSKDNISGSAKANAIKTALKAPSFSILEKSQKETWSKLWEKCDIKIQGDLFAQTVIRFHIFHLIQSASKNNIGIDAGLGPRGLHGEAYRGHIFWDEIFFLPFFNSHLPETAEALLLYRYNRLGEARKYARKSGYHGAMFPWQSGSSGKEETQSIHLNPMSGKWGPDLSRNQRHVSFAIAYNAWQHWVITGNRKFLASCGAEIILSIAKFSASLSVYDKTDGKYHTEGLMGPDEFHEKLPSSGSAGLRDNSYSNVFIVWTLLRAFDVLNLLSTEQSQKIKKKAGISAADLKKWSDISQKMNVTINPRGIISQFDGYFGLKELNWKAYRKKYGNIHRLDRILKSEGKSPDDYKVAKQADVLMLFYLFPADELHQLLSGSVCNFNKKLLRENYTYYETRTSHGSTLSKVVHCYVSHLLGMDKTSINWFTNVLEADIHDAKNGTTLEGIHTGIMGGSIDLALRAFAGVVIEKDQITVQPRLPAAWKQMDFCFQVRDVLVNMKVSNKSVRITTEKQKPGAKELVFIIKNKEITVPHKKRVSVKL